MTDCASIIVIGIGNDFRGDDSVGLEVARRLARAGLSDVEIVEGISDGSSLLNIWGNRRLAIVIDCVRSGDVPGKVFRFEGRSESIPATLFSNYSTHSLSVYDALRMGEALNQLPHKLLIYGIEAGDTDCGVGLTSDVSRAMEEVTNSIINEIEATHAVSEGSHA